MIRMECVKGLGLRVPQRFRRQFGGDIRDGYCGMRAWYPRPEDRLFHLIQWHGDGWSADYYVLRKSDGEAWLLKCSHPRRGGSTLDVPKVWEVPGDVWDMFDAYWDEEEG